MKPAQHDRACRARVHQLPQPGRVLDRAQGPHSWRVQSFDRRTGGDSPGREDQRVIADPLLTAWSARHDLASHRVKGDDLVLGAHVQVELSPQTFRGLHEQAVRVGDLAAYVVGQAAARERHVLAPLQHDDLG